MIKRPTSAREWKNDQGRSIDQDRTDTELTSAIDRSMVSLTEKLNALVQKQTERNA
jgi:hypothetical protein